LRVDWTSQTVRLSLVSAGQTLRFYLPAYTAGYAGFPTDTADLMLRDGRWWLHVVVSLPDVEIAPIVQAQAPVAAERHRWAKRHLKRVRHKHARFRRDCDHGLSKQIVGRSSQARRLWWRTSPTFAHARSCDARRKRNGDCIRGHSRN
jgi:putative transposase